MLSPGNTIASKVRYLNLAAPADGSHIACENDVCLMQEVVAPFLLENLGCSGNEARLVDCPVVVNGLRSYFSNDYYDVDSDYQNAGICDPFAADGGTFARVACGTISSAGVLASFWCVHNNINNNNNIYIYIYVYIWMVLFNLMYSNNPRILHAVLTVAADMRARCDTLSCSQ